MGKNSTVKPAFMEFIPKGRANAISLHDLCGKVGLESSEMKERIKNARIAGHTIASCNQGYFIPLTDRELIAYYTAVCTEVLDVRILLCGKRTGLSDAAIRERMRSVYA